MPRLAITTDKLSDEGKRRAMLEQEIRAKQYECDDLREKYANALFSILFVISNILQSCGKRMLSGRDSD